jgi:peptidoglycan/LPS O-acetylase OafA/YrhL
MIETLEESQLIEKPVTARPIVHSLSWLRGIAALMVCIFHVKKYIWTSTTPDIFTRAFEQGFLGSMFFLLYPGL